MPALPASSSDRVASLGVMFCVENPGRQVCAADAGGGRRHGAWGPPALVHLGAQPTRPRGPGEAVRGGLQGGAGADACRVPRPAPLAPPLLLAGRVAGWPQAVPSLLGTPAAPSHHPPQISSALCDSLVQESLGTPRSSLTAAGPEGPAVA